MRTAEEIKAEIKRKWDKIEAGPVEDRFKRSNCQGCLQDLLQFIDSEPACKHPNARYFTKWDGVAIGLGQLLVSLRGATVPETPKPKQAKFCPDCGEKLETPKGE